MVSLRKRYLSARAEQAPPAPDLDDPSLEHALETACARAEASARFAIDRARLVEELAKLEEPLEALPKEVPFELALAVACCERAPAALAQLEADYLRPAQRALAAMGLSEADRKDVMQEVQSKLLVAEEGDPKLLSYAGKGSLRGLLKVMSTRTAISMLRKSNRETPQAEPLLDLDGGTDPELSFLKSKYRQAFVDALETAAAKLEPRERNLMRLHHLRKVKLEALAKMYGVHRATIVRHLAHARDKLERETHRALSQRLGSLEKGEVEDVLRLISSRFDASVERLLKTIDEPTR